jgi:acetate kinase
MKILVLNAGSSSLKCELYEASGSAVQQPALWKAQADWKELPGTLSIEVESAGKPKTRGEAQAQSLEHTVEQLLRGLIGGDHAVLRQFQDISITGHRVVHGGNKYRESTRLTPEVRQGIRGLAPFAPLHNPLALQVIEATDQVLGGASDQIAVFDTAFHVTLPPESYLYPGPKEWAEQGLRRYGFHGISHQYVSQTAAALVAPAVGKPPDQLRMITCHLGNGCSLCAVKGGQSVETTMGFTPLEGLMMGSRSGTVDPGLLIYLQKHDRHSVDDVDRILNHESGFKGLSGSSDLRQVLAAADQGNQDAATALNVFTYRLAYFISALLPSLGGLDALLFAGGIGEHSSFVREQCCARLSFLGLAVDPALNRSGTGNRLVSSADSRIPVGVIETEENFQIARECLKLAASH